MYGLFIFQLLTVPGRICINEWFKQLIHRIGHKNVSVKFIIRDQTQW